MKNIGRFIFTGLLFLVFCSGGNLTDSRNCASAQEQADWKQEYADICAKTQNAMGLTAGDLRQYIARCEKLQERIDRLEGPKAETERKVYTKRLKMCKELYEFALGYKENKE